MNRPPAISWHQSIDCTLPWWEDFQEPFKKLLAATGSDLKLPNVSALQALLSPSVVNAQGKTIQFAPPSSLPEGNYEEQIFKTGRVSTRTNNWHDFFNALVWARFPALKAAMNSMHFQEIQKQSGTVRGKLRDALTLWDECGVIVASTSDQVIHSLAQRNWRSSFQDSSHLWQDHVRVFICGHALLEKFLNPYKSITAHTVFVKVANDSLQNDRATLRMNLDKSLALKLGQGELIKTTADLSPLPLAGIPGWWKECAQNEQFYADTSVFRVPLESVNPRPVLKLRI